MIPVDEIDFIPPARPTNGGGGFDDYHTAHSIFSVLMIVTCILALCVVPFVIAVWHHYKYHQEEEDDDDLVGWQPPVSKRRLIQVWCLVSFPLIIGLWMLTYWASEAVSISNYDYYGPMKVQSYNITARDDFLSTSSGYGLTRRHVLELTVSVELKWGSPATTGGSNTNNNGSSSSIIQCTSKNVTYTPCNTVVTPCQSEEEQCSNNEEMQKSIAQAKSCIQEALQQSTRHPIEFFLANDDDTFFHRIVVTNEEEEEQWPTLFFHGDLDTCDAEYRLSNTTSTIRRFGYSGGVLTLIGILLQAIYCFRRGMLVSTKDHHDGDTECSSVSSMIEEQLGKQDERQPEKDEELGKV
jgi:hypothetical protein